MDAKSGALSTRIPTPARRVELRPGAQLVIAHDTAAMHDYDLK